MKQDNNKKGDETMTMIELHGGQNSSLKVKFLKNLEISSYIGKVKSQAFTLAEVLITLGIIGIVAAMTLPSMVQKNRNKQLETGLKRGYSVLGQALQMYQAQSGEPMKPADIRQHELKEILMKKLMTVRDCGLGYNDKEKACIPNYGGHGGEGDNRNSNTYQTYNKGNTINLNYFDDGQFVLNDGTLVLLENEMANGRSNIFLSIDVNGFKHNPNRLGHDLFMFQINSKGTLIPMGVEGTVYYDVNDRYCSSTSTDRMNGAGCTYKALTDKNYFNDLPK